MCCVGGKLTVAAETKLQPVESLIDGFHERQNLGGHVIGRQADIEARRTDVLRTVRSLVERPDRKAENDEIGAQQEKQNGNDDPDHLLQKIGENVVDDHVAMRQFLRDLDPDGMAVNVLAGAGSRDGLCAARGSRSVRNNSDRIRIDGKERLLARVR